MISDDKVEEIRSANDIVSVVQGYITLKKRGQNWIGLCPFHTEKTPSFNVNAQRQIFKCFGCGKGGNVFSFVAEMEKIGYGDAIRQLAERAGIALPRYTRNAREDEPSEAELIAQANAFARDFFYQQLTNQHSSAANAARDYLYGRGYGDEIIDTYLLGYAPDGWEGLTDAVRRAGLSLPIFLKAGLLKEGRETGRPYDAFRHRVIFPIRNLSGRVVAFGGRTLRGVESGEPAAAHSVSRESVATESGNAEAKYINSPETVIYTKGRELFGLYEAKNEIRKQDQAILVEGYTDCLSLVKSGVRIAVASLGTSLTQEQARLLARFTPNVCIFYDGDNAGLNASRRAIDVLLTVGAAPRVMMQPPDDDPDTFIQKYGSSEVWNLVNGALSPVEFQMALAARTNAPLRESVRALVESAALIGSPVDREVFLQTVSNKTGIGTDSLLQEMARTRRASDTNVSAPAKRTWPAAGALTDLTRVLVAEPTIRPVIFEQWRPVRLTDAKLEAVLDTLYEEWAGGEMAQAERILHAFADPEVRDYLSDCLMEAVNDGDQDADKKLEIKKQVALDCVKKLAADQIKQEIAELKSRLVGAGAQEAELLARLQELKRREKELRG